jgi:hypothetical protein
VFSVTSILLLLCAFALPVFAQTYPSSGQIYLSFSEHRHVQSLDVTPGVPFQLWIRVEIPVVSESPEVGVAGIEGAVAFPPSVEFMSIEFPPPAVSLGASVREPGLETFIVGLGECLQLGPAQTIGVLTLRLLTPEVDVEIGVTAPAVQAAAISSFAGIGPGWAAWDCGQGDIELVLFDDSAGLFQNVVLNSTAVPVESNGFTALKSRYRD